MTSYKRSTSFGTPVMTEIHTCGDCGSNVPEEDQGIHSAWHSQITSMISQLQMENADLIFRISELEELEAKIDDLVVEKIAASLHSMVEDLTT